MSRRSLQAVGAGCRAEQARAGDALQRPLRSRFQARLTLSVQHQTSNQKDQGKTNTMPHVIPSYTASPRTSPCPRNTVPQDTGRTHAPHGDARRGRAQAHRSCPGTLPVHTHDTRTSARQGYACRGGVHAYCQYPHTLPVSQPHTETPAQAVPTRTGGAHAPGGYSSACRARTAKTKNGRLASRSTPPNKRMGYDC
jgi:hypothetical protein